jgi:hypothetical protein
VFLLFYDAGGVTIAWQTASEVDTMGFNLLRAQDSSEGPFRPINAELIPAKGDPLTGAEYRVEDEKVEPGRLYFYQIEEVEWSGAQERYPEVVQARAGVPRSWLLAEGAVLILLGCALFYLQARQLRRSSREPAVLDGP